MINKYEHLTKRQSIHNQNNWSTNLLQRALGQSFFENMFLKNFLKAIELILVAGFTSSLNVKKYFKF